MNTKLRNGAKNEFEKDFFKLMNNFVFRKTMKNVRKHRDIKLVTTNENRNKLVSEPNYQTIKHFLENLLAIEMKRTKVKMNKPIYLGMSILDINKTLCMNFGLTILNQNMETEKLCYMDTDSFVIHIFTEDFFEDIFDDVKRWFDTSEYDENDKRSLPIGMNKTLIGFFKDEVGGNIMIEFCVIRPKIYSYFWMMTVKRKKPKEQKSV